MTFIKNAGWLMLGIAGVAALLFLFVLVIFGAVVVSEYAMPLLAAAATIATVVCIFFFLPLSLFRATRIVSVWGFLVTSYIFGATAWTYGCLATYDLWGAGGIVIGLLLGGVAIVPIGIIAAALHGVWLDVVELVYDVAWMAGTFLFALYLGKKIDRVKEEASHHALDMAG